MAEYINLVTASGGNPGKIGAWLLEDNAKNARRMTESMFLDRKVNWIQLDPFYILALRACAPSGVFTEKAKGGYLTQVGDDQDRSKLANAMFANDTEFLAKLPKEWQPRAPELRVLMLLAREHGIQ